MPGEPGREGWEGSQGPLTPWGSASCSEQPVRGVGNPPGSHKTNAKSSDRLVRSELFAGWDPIYGLGLGAATRRCRRAPAPPPASRRPRDTRPPAPAAPASAAAPRPHRPCRRGATRTTAAPAVPAGRAAVPRPRHGYRSRATRARAAPPRPRRLCRPPSQPCRPPRRRGHRLPAACRANGAAGSVVAGQLLRASSCDVYDGRGRGASCGASVAPATVPVDMNAYARPSDVGRAMPASCETKRVVEWCSQPGSCTTSRRRSRVLESRPGAERVGGRRCAAARGDPHPNVQLGARKVRRRWAEHLECRLLVSASNGGDTERSGGGEPSAALKESGRWGRRRGPRGGWPGGKPCNV